MKRVILIGLGVLVVGAAALVYFRWPRPAPRAVDLLPETTLVLLETPDFARARAAFRQTAAYALWQEPEIQAFLAKPRQAVRDALGRSATTEQNGIAFLGNVLQGEVFVALTSVSAIPNLQAGVVIGADVRGKLLETRIALANLERKFRKYNPNDVITSKKYLGVRYTAWEKNPHLVICYGLMNSLVVFTLGEDTMRDAIARFTRRLATPTPSLVNSAKFRTVLSHMPPDHCFVAYVNIEQITALVGPFLILAPQGSGLLAKLGSMQAAGASATFAGRAVHEVRFTAYRPNGRKPSAATPRQTMALTAPQTALYHVQPSDLVAIYDQLVQGLAQSGQPKLSASVTQFEQTVRSRGVHIRPDVLANLGPETAVIGQWRAGAQWPDLALVAAVKQAGKTRPAIDVVMTTLKDVALGGDQQSPWDDAPYRGLTLHTVHIGSGKVAPTHVTTDQFFLLASTPDYARELLGQALEAKPTLATNPEYTQAMKPLPASAESYTYCDLRGLYPPLQALAHTALLDADSTAFLDPAKFPHPETVAKHLFPFVAATTGDTNSQTTTSYSPFGTPIGFVAGAVGGFAAARAFAFPAETPTTPARPKRFSDGGVHQPPHGNQAAMLRTPSSE